MEQVRCSGCGSSMVAELPGEAFSEACYCSDECRELEAGWQEVLWWDSYELEAEGPQDSRYCDHCGVYVGSHGIWTSERLLCSECAGA